MPRPFLLRLLPEPLVQRLKGLLAPYVDAALEEYLPPFSERNALPGLLSGAIDGKHIPMSPTKANCIVAAPPAGGPVWADGFAPPPRSLWYEYCDTLDRFMEIGRHNAGTMRAILTRGGGDIGRGDRVLDFGCGAGPVIRCLKEIALEGEVWGVDVSVEHVTWCQQHLSPPFRFAVTTLLPHLPFEDRYFDLVYAGSVFSHISEMADAWLLELSRVIRPGGRLYVTLVTKQSLHDYLEKWPSLGFSREARAAFTPEELSSNFDMLVIRRTPWQHAVFDLEFFRRKCDGMFNVVSVTPNAYSFQWALLLERKVGRRRGDARAASTEQGERA
ncbi:MAG: class I SAM-dependent methyltransferase [Phycisphaerae bacterium]|nr:class I SAM-dependent methyltransferase [Phycisphaerae bacterium]